MAKKLNSDGLNKFFKEKGEYVGLFAAVVAAGLLIYFAFGVPKYPKTPEDLSKQLGTPQSKDPSTAYGVFETADARLNLESEGITTKGGDFVKVIDQLLLTPVNPAAFSGMEWNIPLFDSKQRRTEPEYLALRELRAAFHYGAIDMKVAGGGGAAGAAQVQRRPLGDEWLTVTGLVPFEEQEAAYAEAFRGAGDVRTNAVPKYRPYLIQRAEVVAGDPNLPVDWQNMPNLDLKVYVSDEMNKWAGVGAEYADPLYVSFPPLTQPLPPLSNKDYGDWATHLPEIPVASSAPAAGNAPAAAAAARPAAAANANDPFAQAPANPEPAAPAPVAAADGTKPAKPKYLLFRFLDFNIEPTKFYRYRVKLILNNPNFGLDVAHLDKAELAQGESREAEWSEPSAPVYVPVLEKYFAGEGRSVGGDSEPETSFAVKQWAPRFAADVYYEFDKKLRGALLNDPAATVKHRVPGGNKFAEQSTMLKTDVLLADFAWEKTPDRLKGPGTALEAKTVSKPSEILVRTPRGELMIQSQLGDWWLRDELKGVMAGAAADAPAAAAPGAEPAAPAGDDVRRTLRLQ